MYNTLKVGLDIKDIDSNLKKYGIGYNNDFIPSKIVASILEEKVNELEVMKKKKKKKKNY